MEIVCIFEGKLYSMCYDDEEYIDDDNNEYDRLMSLWSDAIKLNNFIEANKSFLRGNKRAFLKSVSDDVEAIEDIMCDIEDGYQNVASFFRNLNNENIRFGTLELQKSNLEKRTYLRLYAIRIDDDTYLITGGAIKLWRAMQDHESTRKELVKMNKVKQYLTNSGVFDQDSFNEHINPELNESE